MDKINFSTIKRNHSVLQWFFPFQSWIQFTSFWLLVVMVLLIMAAVLLQIEPDAPKLIFVIAPLGGIPALYMMLPSRLEISTSGHLHTSKIFTALEELVQQFGYIPMPSSGKEFRYRGKWSEWVTWEKNGVAISKLENSMVILGPAFTLSLIKKRLDNKMQALA